MKRVRWSAEELEVMAQALALWEAGADEDQDGDVSSEDARRLRSAWDSASTKVAILAARKAAGGEG